MHNTISSTVWPRLFAVKLDAGLVMVKGVKKIYSLLVCKFSQIISRMLMDLIVGYLLLINWMSRTRKFIFQVYAI